METTASLVASIVSVIIGGFAIWLSVTFYRMSNKISEDTKEAAKGISASVNRLESLFDSLYSDTFSMMKDTVSDMRKHIWPEKEESSEALKQIEQKADAQIEELKKQIGDEISGVMKRVGRTDSKIDDVEKNLEQLVDRAIQQTRKVESEAQEEKSVADTREHVYIYINLYGDAKVGDIMKQFRGTYSPGMIIKTLNHLIKEKRLFADGKIRNPNTIISSRGPQ